MERDGTEESGGGVLEESVTITAAYHVVPGRESDFSSWAAAVLDDSGRIPGFLGGDVLAPGEAGGGGFAWQVVQRFDSERSALVWEGSTARTQWEAYANPFAWKIDGRVVRGPAPRAAEQPVPVQAFAGSPAGMPMPTGAPAAAPAETSVPAPPPPVPPPKWKLWFVNMSAVFPPVLVFNVTVLPYLGGVNPLLRTLLLCLCVTALVTWVLMPRLQRFFKKWLNPPLQALRGRHRRRAAQ